jgi:hypothetical protein
MMGLRRDHRQLKARRLRRLERERAAGTLLDACPDLTSLSIALEDSQPDDRVEDERYVRRVVVEHAKAVFDIPCSGDGCADGGHDITEEILAGLRSRQAAFTGERRCLGRRSAAPCGRILRYVANATYGRVAGSEEPACDAAKAVSSSSAPLDLRKGAAFSERPRQVRPLQPANE